MDPFQTTTVKPALGQGEGGGVLHTHPAVALAEGGGTLMLDARFLPHFFYVIRLSTVISVMFLVTKLSSVPAHLRQLCVCEFQAL